MPERLPVLVFRNGSGVQQNILEVDIEPLIFQVVRLTPPIIVGHARQRAGDCGGLFHDREAGAADSAHGAASG